MAPKEGNRKMGNKTGPRGGKPVRKGHRNLNPEDGTHKIQKKKETFLKKSLKRSV